MSVQLPDDWETLLLDTETRRVTVRGMVARQQLVRLACKGLDATRAAKLVGMNPHTVRAIYREPAFRKEVYGKVDSAFVDVDKIFVETKKDLHELIAEQASNAFQVLKGMLEEESTLPSLKVKIAQDFLDRNPESQAGHSVTRLNPALGVESLQQAARIAREMDEKVTPIRRRA